LLKAEVHQSELCKDKEVCILCPELKDDWFSFVKSRDILAEHPPEEAFPFAISLQTVLRIALNAGDSDGGTRCGSNLSIPFPHALYLMVPSASGNRPLYPYCSTIASGGVVGRRNEALISWSLS